MTVPMSDARFSAIEAMRFTTGLNAATGVFDTPVERELYDLAARNYNARLELQAEVKRLRAELLDFTHPVVTCFGCHHIAPWHVGSLGAVERPCTQPDCNCTDLVKETSR
jgi:hypothetical protein